jgi:hypothetical protein
MTELQQVMNLAIENWDDTLRKNAFNLPYASLPINGLIYGHGIEQFTIPELAGVMQRWTFAKLSTRSPKDFLCDGGQPKQLNTAEEVLDALLASERCFDDLCSFAREGITPMLHLFKWRYIDPLCEFRCFVKKRKLIAVSQYDYGNRGFKDVSHLPYELAGIHDLHDRIHASVPADDVVMDVVHTDGGDMRLLELNPYGMSDPCLFTYKELDEMSDGSCELRYNNLVIGRET